MKLGVYKLDHFGGFVFLMSQNDIDLRLTKVQTGERFATESEFCCAVAESFEVQRFGNGKAEEGEADSALTATLSSQYL